CNIGRLSVVEDVNSVDSIKCTSGSWLQKIDSESINLHEPFTVMCGTKACAQCEVLPPIDCQKPYTCKDPDALNVIGDDCAKTTCDHNRWFLEIDGRIEWMDNPTFEWDRTKTDDPIWKVNGVEVTKVSCTPDYDCFTHSALILECASLHAPCLYPIKNITEGIQKIVCYPGFLLKLCDDEDCKEINGDSLECQKNTGLFSYRPKTIPRGASIGCYETEESIAAYFKPLDDPATGSIDILIVPIVVVGLVALIGLAVAIFYLKKLRNEPFPSPPQEPVVVAPARKAKKKNTK
ncbi:hypothetical protein PENTCL1PPCAC_18404, partial [Pristionchus entomophagus]